nr:hypothetical protein CFP56_47909 [Quercus suber]
MVKLLKYTNQKHHLFKLRYKFGRINNLQSKSTHYSELHHLCSQPRLRFMPPQNSLEGYPKAPHGMNIELQRHACIIC